jgi:hypothetical protein
MSLETVQEALAPLKTNGAGWAAKCPAHDDKAASLSLAGGDDGKVLLRCHAGCELGDIVSAAGLEMADVFPPSTNDRPAGVVATYDYIDADGTLLCQVLRYQPKTFRQRQPEGDGWKWGLDGVKRVLYNLPALVDDRLKEWPVLVVEGEKDADNLADVGFPTATTCLGGANAKWLLEYSEVLRGRKVALLPDNDAPGQAHADKIAKALDGIAESVVIVKLPGLPPKGDVSDFLDAGGTAKDIMQLIASAQPRPKPSFRAAGERLEGERANRLREGERRLGFGVAFLDDALGGISVNDLVLLGAKTGAGKTEAASTIALNVCQAGKRVHYFALEAEDLEIERRIKFRVLADLFYRGGGSGTALDYQAWRGGDLDRLVGHLEERATREASTLMANLHVLYDADSFGPDEFCDHFEKIQADTDLVILDHLHYMDTGENENRGFKKLMQTVRSAALKAGKPVLMIAHVRKADRKFDPLIPTIEDFHGSSDIAKIVTKAIMLAPAWDRPSSEAHKPYTYMQIAKNRTRGTATRFAALTAFNLCTHRYDDTYEIGRLVESGKKFQHLTGMEVPHWAKHAVSNATGELESGDDDV